MNDKAQRPPQLEELLLKIRDCLDKGHYRQTKHAIERKSERKIDMLDVLYVLKNGRHEKQKTSFDETFQTWKYAIRGKTLDDEMDVRIIIAFDESGMMIITVMHVG